MKTAILFCFCSLLALGLFAQPVPAEEENIPYLVTFGKNADPSWGDDDYCQTFFFSIPSDQKTPFYIRVYDPDCGGEIDEMKETFNTMTRFSVFGGKSCITDDDARSVDPIGNYKSGTLLASKTFGGQAEYDEKWYTFGPFNPVEGELSEKYGGYIFKMICEGVRGDDGNLYKYYLSNSPDANESVEGGNAFTFEYTFRLHADSWQTSHVYPYIDDAVVYLAQSNFDWDDDGYIRIYSVVSFAEELETSGDNNWARNQYTIKDEERGKSLDIQFTKDESLQINNNNVVFYVTNQYGELLPFYTVPIGGVPRYQGKAVAKPIQRR
ncbi:hypothetical protein [Sanyastnella coralliicola]|uniref:hypothetical protein n=1 Tax=Sanyastnella coralliicola TaxID=3069118 RepID=UPI0027B99B80|nr:hypothetical protein [Longitalea sp. SCSIO 12813]